MGAKFDEKKWFLEFIVALLVILVVSGSAFFLLPELKLAAIKDDISQNVSGFIQATLGSAVALAGAYAAIRIASAAHGIQVSADQRETFADKRDHLADKREQLSFERDSRLAQYDFARRIINEITPIYANIARSLQDAYLVYIRFGNAALQEKVSKEEIAQEAESFNKAMTNVAGSLFAIQSNLYAYRISRVSGKKREILPAFFSEVTGLSLSATDSPIEIGGLIDTRVKSLKNQPPLDAIRISKGFANLSSIRGVAARDFVGMGALIWLHTKEDNEGGASLGYDVGAAMMLDIANLLPDEEGVRQAMTSIFGEVFGNDYVATDLERLLEGYNPYLWLGSSLVSAISGLGEDPKYALTVNISSKSVLH